MKDVLWIVITALGAATLVSPIGAQGPPAIQAMLKWQQAQAIRYDVVAEYIEELSKQGVPDVRRKMPRAEGQRLL